jgi:hypothetical protein
MSVRTHRLSVLFLPVVSLVLAGAGCSPQVHTYTTAKSLWESPIIRETRALLSVPNEELSILSVDGKSAQSSRLDNGPVKEYFLPGGEHDVTAEFSYSEVIKGAGLGGVHGLPITLKQSFVVGHKYLASYRQFVVPRPEPEGWLDQIIADVINPQREYWSLEITDVTEPEAAQATDG